MRNGVIVYSPVIPRAVDLMRLMRLMRSPIFLRIALSTHFDPFPERTPDHVIDGFAKRVVDIVRFAHTAGEVTLLGLSKGLNIHTNKVVFDYLDTTTGQV